jgi:hypothetical protein
MNEMDSEPFTLFPVGTQVFTCEGNEVSFVFPTPEDAIIFFEFIGSFVRGEIELHAVSK